MLLSVAIGYRIPMLRMMSTQETAVFFARIAAREERHLSREEVLEVATSTVEAAR